MFVDPLSLSLHFIWGPTLLPNFSLLPPPPPSPPTPPPPLWQLPGNLTQQTMGGNIFNVCFMFKKLFYHYYWYALFVIMICNNSCPLLKKMCPPRPRVFITLVLQYYSVICCPSDHTLERPWVKIRAQEGWSRGRDDPADQVVFRVCMDYLVSLWAGNNLPNEGWKQLSRGGAQVAAGPTNG